MIMREVQKGEKRKKKRKLSLSCVLIIGSLFGPSFRFFLFGFHSTLGKNRDETIEQKKKEKREERIGIRFSRIVSQHEA